MSADVDSMRFYELQKKFKKNFTSKCRAVVLIPSRRHNARSAINKYIHQMKSEKIENLGNYDCFGNIGSVKTEKDFYIFNGSTNIPWLRMSDKESGTMKFNSKYSTCQFTPTH
jgi:hypothetical protein